MMGSKTGGGSRVDLWSEIIAEEEGGGGRQSLQQQQQQPIYQRRRRQTTPQNQITSQDANLKQLELKDKDIRVSFGGGGGGRATKRVSWNRSLSTRGRISIAVAACVDNQPQQKQARKRGKPPVPKGKAVQPPNFEKEKQYFEEVDAFELLEESPSPKNSITWATGNETDAVVIPHMSSRLEKWLIAKKLNYSCEPSSTLSKILETPTMPPLGPMSGDDFSIVDVITPEKAVFETNSKLHSVHSRIRSYLPSKGVLERNSLAQKSSSMFVGREGCEDIEGAVKKLSLASTSSLSDHDYVDPVTALLAVCGQSVPSTLLEVFSKYCEPENIVKVGEGTYGEAFKAGNTVCKIVPIDGDLLVNGEVQKRSEELLEEAILSRTLNNLRSHDADFDNSCTTFIETLDLRVCQGPYDPALVKAWEYWDEKHGSENDHPKEFPEKQCYVVFVLQHGGKDLESFVLLNFDEAQSLLVQVTAGLAVAEAAYEFEHRDLHWGNILLRRNESATVQFILEGKKMIFRTSGLLISIIDFTLSRINTGQDILFLDLTRVSDPYLFKGPKGDRQAETYRKMKEVTEDFWEGSFPKTNVLWLLYLVDILLLKKSFDRSSKNERDLRSFKKRLSKYNSAKEAIISDPFFSNLLVV
ncbi:LOW QUALITY PROTEIN: serine/threonine-protein kinase haspin homolog [Populus alba]|uniref:LOW QUALITY PROTEIN: serine/threonine-protein kinase haspin homolog n=1 Tax=Populus alba TaxID=43335 RepID=UPI003CC6F370